MRGSNWCTPVFIRLSVRVCHASTTVGLPFAVYKADARPRTGVAVTCHQYREDCSLPGYTRMAEYNSLHEKKKRRKTCAFQTTQSAALLFIAEQLLCMKRAKPQHKATSQVPFMEKFADLLTKTKKFAYLKWLLHGQ